VIGLFVTAGVVIGELVRVVVVNVIVVDDGFIVLLVVVLRLLYLVPNFENQRQHQYGGREYELGENNGLKHAEQHFDFD
jgi:hypothetical protein